MTAYDSGWTWTEQDRLATGKEVEEEYAFFAYQNTTRISVYLY